MALEVKLLISLLWVAVCGFALLHRARLRQLTFWGLLLAALIGFLLNWAAVALEDVFWTDVWGVVEHATHLASAALLAAWCWAALVRTPKHDAAADDM